jgi:hypothetical protein
MPMQTFIETLPVAKEKLIIALQGSDAPGLDTNGYKSFPERQSPATPPFNDGKPAQ